jgi:hypothetical protein
MLDYLCRGGQRSHQIKHSSSRWWLLSASSHSRRLKMNQAEPETRTVYNEHDENRYWEEYVDSAGTPR